MAVVGADHLGEGCWPDSPCGGSTPLLPAALSGGGCCAQPPLEWGAVLTSQGGTCLHEAFVLSFPFIDLVACLHQCRLMGI